MTPDVRPLVAGNWKMNGLTASLAEIEAMRAAVDAGEAGRRRTRGLPAGTLIAAAPPRSSRAARCARRAGLQPARQRRLHRRHFRADAQGCRRDLCHRRPFRAPHLSSRDRRRRARQGGGGAEGRARLRSSASARRAPSARRARRSPSSRARCEARCPPAARPDTVVVAYEPVWAIGTGLTPTSGRLAEVHKAIRALLGEIVRRVRRQGAHPLRRLGQAGQRQGAPRASTTSTARWSAARASRPPISWRSPPPIAEAGSDSRRDGRAPCAVIGARHLF